MSITPVTPQADPYAEFGATSAPTSTPTAADPYAELGATTTPTASPAGEQTNDIGKTVIVPKEGETFSDTMARAAQHGKNVTQQDINDEMATAPKKVATTLVAAPIIGAAGAASLAAPGEAIQGVRAIPGLTETLLQHAETKAAEWAAQYPHLISLAKNLGIPTSTAAVLGWLYHNSKGK